MKNIFLKNKILFFIISAVMLFLVLYTTVLADASSKFRININPLCGNSIVEIDEQCDGTSMGLNSCFTLGFSGGALSCNPNCGFNTSNCTICGNGVVEGSEQCDRGALSGQSCPSKGFVSGSLACYSNCTFNVSSCSYGNSGPTGGGGGGGGGALATPKEVAISFSGRAYPNSRVTLLKDAQIVMTTIAGPDANFFMKFVDNLGGNYTFSIFSEDSNFNKSTLLTFPVVLSGGSSSHISGIFIAPTISTDKKEVKHGDNIAIFGQSLPNSEVTIVINSAKEHYGRVITDKNGVYLFNFDTTPLEIDDHSAKSKTNFSGEISPFSKSVAFVVGDSDIENDDISEVKKADFNGDNKINIVDFSISAYWYKRDNPPAEIDLNKDGKIDLIDFSIMAFYWTG